MIEDLGKFASLAIDRQTAFKKSHFEKQKMNGAHWSQTENQFSITDMEIELKKTQELERIRKEQEEKIKSELAKKSKNDSEITADKPPRKHRYRNHRRNQNNFKNHKTDQEMQDNLNTNTDSRRPRQPINRNYEKKSENRPENLNKNFKKPESNRPKRDHFRHRNQRIKNKAGLKNENEKFENTSEIPKNTAINS